MLTSMPSQLGKYLANGGNHDESKTPSVFPGGVMRK
jgi:hypothetical protein